MKPEARRRDRGRWRRRGQKVLATAAVYALMTAIALIFMIPLLWMLSTSLKTRADIFAWPPEWVPAAPTWGHYELAFAKSPLGLSLVHT